MANTQLPAEVVTEIHAKADVYIASSEDEGTEWAAYVNGATEYAIKLHHAHQEIESLTNQLKGHAGVSNENIKLLKQENEKARSLLEKFISRHEGGLLPDRFIYNEIKTFLDGKY
jgi:hypothetical protein